MDVWLQYKEKFFYSQDYEVLEHAALRCDRSPFPRDNEEAEWVSE